MKTAIVCEGGGMRGVYTSGVLQTFMEQGFTADALIGVSAGASNGISYVSHQLGRGMRTNIDYAGDKRYASMRNYLRTRSVFGMDFIFGEIPEKLDPFDYEAFRASPIDFYAGATDIDSGQIVYFGKEDIEPGLVALRASCSMPVFSPIVAFKGKKYLDGGVTAPIPVDKALDGGYERIIVILTQALGYRKKPQSGMAFCRRLYKAYPNLVRAIEERHIVYNRTLDQISALEKEGRAILIAPRAPLSVDRFGKDREKLIASYNEGLLCGKDALAKL